MKKLHYNGYIVQRKIDYEYKGVDGDNWYLNYCSNNSFFQEFCDENIYKSWYDLDYVDCCSDKSYVKQCINESKKLGIDYRILLCATCRNLPKLEKLELGKIGEVIGYDYAYSGGSYYSCILNDIISGRIEEFKDISLNKYGLFNTYEEAEKFSQLRNSLLVKDINYIFERGDFIIYEITEVIV